MRARLCAQLALSMSLLLLVTALPAAVHAAPYSYQVDRFEIDGNDPGTYVDEFDDGILDPWVDHFGTVSESGGVLSLTDPGDLDLSFTPGLPVVRESSFVSTYETAFVSDGGGDFIATSTWLVTDVALNQSLSMSLGWEASPGIEENLTILIGNADAELASFFGIPTGLGAIASLGTALHGSETEPGGSLGLLLDAVALDPADVTGDILLRVTFDDTDNSVTPWYSLDGGASFHSPFASLGGTFDDESYTWWSLRADQWSVIPEPSTTLLLFGGLAGLAAAGRRPSRG